MERRVATVGFMALLALGTQTNAQPAASNALTATVVRGLSTSELAQRLLPSELRAKVSSHRLVTPGLGLWPNALFYGPVQPLPGGACKRESYEAVLGRAEVSNGRPETWPLKVTGVASRVTISLDGLCDADWEGAAASVSPAVDVDDAIATLSWLAEQRENARRGRPIPAELSCNSEVTLNPCGYGPLRALGGLTVTNALSLTKEAGGAWRIWIAPVLPTMSGTGVFDTWEVKVERVPGTQSKIALRYFARRLPPPA
jgi:hypothetical protein